MLCIPASLLQRLVFMRSAQNARESSLCEQLVKNHHQTCKVTLWNIFSAVLVAGTSWVSPFEGRLILNKLLVFELDVSSASALKTIKTLQFELASTYKPDSALPHLGIQFGLDCVPMCINVFSRELLRSFVQQLHSRN